MPGTLYIVSLPIGNPDDITAHALRILRSVDLIAAEDTRVSSRFCAQHAITTPCLSYRKRSDRDTTTPILLHLEQGNSVALICDAGTPAIADPGQELITEAIKRGIPLDTAPGPVAAIVALILSGLPTGRFAFDGFPPRARADRAEFFRGLSEEARTILLYESAAMLRSTLQELTNVLSPDRRIVIARELTTPDQALFRGTLSDALASFNYERKRGRYTLVIAGKTVYTRKDNCK